MIKYYKHLGDVFDEDPATFYFEFEDEYAIRQMIEFPTCAIYLDEKNYEFKGHILCDQLLSELELDDSDEIDAEEFEKKWKNNPLLK
jgi:hypothetical protein